MYYFYAYFHIDAEAQASKKVNISVPSGNFGNIFSGFLAKRMGLPIHKLIIATNENNILERFVRTGEYKPGDFKSTNSPSMDIQVASNFERYLYYLLDENVEKVSEYMKQLQTEGKIVVSPELLARVQADFAAYGASNEECLKYIGEYNQEYDYLLDPHTACGIAAYQECSEEDEVTITFATAHPAKFDEAIALCMIEQKFPEEISALLSKPQYQHVVDHDQAEIVRELEVFYGDK
ncbi:Threonine synthase [compost metagenome]